METVSCYCLKCKWKLGVFQNAWNNIGKTYYSPVESSYINDKITGFRATGRVRLAAKQSQIANSFVQDLECRKCETTVGLRCDNAPLGHILKKDQLILRVDSMSVISNRTGDPVNISVQKVSAVTAPNSSTSIGQNLRPDLQNQSNERQPTNVSVDAGGKGWEQFVQWAKEAIKTQLKDIDRIGSVVDRIEGRMRTLENLMNELRKELATEPQLSMGQTVRRTSMDVSEEPVLSYLGSKSTTKRKMDQLGDERGNESAVEHHCSGLGAKRGRLSNVTNIESSLTAINPSSVAQLKHIMPQQPPHVTWPSGDSLISGLYGENSESNYEQNDINNYHSEVSKKKTMGPPSILPPPPPRQPLKVPLLASTDNNVPSDPNLPITPITAAKTAPAKRLSNQQLRDANGILLTSTGRPDGRSLRHKKGNANDGDKLDEQSNGLAGEAYGLDTLRAGKSIRHRNSQPMVEAPDELTTVSNHRHPKRKSAPNIGALDESVLLTAAGMDIVEPWDVDMKTNRSRMQDRSSGAKVSHLSKQDSEMLARARRGPLLPSIEMEDADAEQDARRRILAAREKLVRETLERDI